MKYYGVGIELTPDNGGPTKSVPCFARALGGRVVSFTQPARLPDAESDQDIFHIRAVRGLLGRAYLIAPSSEIKRLDALTANAELLSCHILYRHSAHWVVSRAKRRGIPYWVVPHGCLDPYVFSYGPPVKRLWMRLFGRRMLREAAAVIFSTRREMEKAACWMDRDNGHVVHWPAELPNLGEGQAQRARWRAEQGFQDQDTVLLSLGRLHSMKRPLETVDALASSGMRTLRLVFIGPEGDVNGATILARARSLGVGDRVSVLPPAYGPEKFDAIFGCDAYVSLSIRENFNNAAAESLACGRPVILSPGNDLGPDLEEYECAHLIGDNSVGSAAEAFRLAGVDSLRAAQMGRNARRFAEERLSFDRFRAALMEIANASK